MLVHDKFFDNPELVRSSVVEILHAHKIDLYHLYLHQELHKSDFQNRVQFAEWFLQQVLMKVFFF